MVDLDGAGLAWSECLWIFERSTDINMCSKKCTDNYQSGVSLLALKQWFLSTCQSASRTVTWTVNTMHCLIIVSCIVSSCTIGAQVPHTNYYPIIWIAIKALPLFLTNEILSCCSSSQCYTCTACWPCHICARLQCSGPVHCIISILDVPQLSIVFLQTVVRLSSQSYALTHTFHHVV